VSTNFVELLKMNVVGIRVGELTGRLPDKFDPINQLRSSMQISCTVFDTTVIAVDQQVTNERRDGFSGTVLLDFEQCCFCVLSELDVRSLVCSDLTFLSP
jgi:hypothetical protein